MNEFQKITETIFEMDINTKPSEFPDENPSQRVSYSDHIPNA